MARPYLVYHLAHVLIPTFLSLLPCAVFILLETVFIIARNLANLTANRSRSAYDFQGPPQSGSSLALPAFISLCKPEYLAKPYTLPIYLCCGLPVVNTLTPYMSSQTFPCIYPLNVFIADLAKY